MKAVLLSQNVKLESVEKLNQAISCDEPIVIVSTQKLFDNEKSIIEKYLTVERYLIFSDFMTDAEMERCDKQAFDKVKMGGVPGDSVCEYYDQIKVDKNLLVIKRLRDDYNICEGFICADDLGIDKDSWVRAGFDYFKLSYYYEPVENRNILVRIKNKIKSVKPFLNLFRMAYYVIKKKQTEEVYTSEWKGEKYVFIGSLNKVGYRMSLEWTKSEEEYKRLKSWRFEKAEKCHYLTSLHEWTKCKVPSSKKYDVSYIQDGYLPPNYSSLYLRFVPKNVKYYAWDSLGMKIFINQGVPASIMPFRKKIYIPEVRIASTIKKILIVTSGAGDWTAVKNRSDEDFMVEAFGKIAKLFPEIEFVYRCHPVWVHPMHQGVNSINRVAEYFEYLKLPNIKTSSNIIEERLGDFKLSLPRQSMDADLEGTDLVIGEHSIAMVDGAFKGIPFASLNLTGRRDLFGGITDLGFPHFESIEGLVDFIRRFPTDEELQSRYKKAIQNYNNMTDED